MSEIDDKYRSLGGPRSFLGSPFDAGAGTEEQATGKGRIRDYENGSILWSPQTGAHEVHGDIRVKWAQHRGTRGILGFPTSDEMGTPDGRGRYNHFVGGSIYWTPSTGAHEVHGAIRDKWASLGWERSRLGYPITDELDGGNGHRHSRFEGGTITWTATAGAVVSYGSID